MRPKFEEKREEILNIKQSNIHCFLTPIIISCSSSMSVEFFIPGKMVNKESP